jgi:hypothetical protein
MCQLHLREPLDLLSAAPKTQGTAELLSAVPDLEEKLNITKILMAMSGQDFVFLIGKEEKERKKLGTKFTAPKLLCNL